MTNKEAISVLKQIKKYPTMQVFLPDEYEALNLAIKALEERPQGEWIADKNRTYSENEDTWECSVCHEPFTIIEGTPEENLYYYCPKCGARLIADGGEK